MSELLDVGRDDGDLEGLGGNALGGGEPRAGQYTGTKALMLAVLEDGIASYLSSAERTRTEAESWLAAPGRSSPFAFTVICETLGLEPDAVRLALKQLRTSRASPQRAIRRSRPNVRRVGRLIVGKAL